MARLMGSATPSLPAVQYLQAGGGFGGVVTPTPGPTGDALGVGYNTHPVMGWDAVPFLDVTGEVLVGVIETHAPTNAERANGMKSNVVGVQFSVNGGEWVFEERRRTNPQSGAPDCFYVGLRASDFADGLVEVRAIPIVSTGHHKVMQGDDVTGPYHSMFFNMNGYGGLFTATRFVDQASGSDTLNDGMSYGAPFKTMSKARASIFTASGNATVGGGRIVLKAGSYSLGDAVENSARSSGNRWLRVEAAPNEDVVFDRMYSLASDYTGLNVSRLAISGCQFTGAQRLRAKDETQWLYLEDFSFVGEGQQVTGAMGGSLIAPGVFRYIWADRGTYTDARSGLRGARLLNAVHYERIGEDAFSGVRTAICSTSVVQDRGAANIGSWHPDWFAFNTPRAGDADHTQRNTLFWHCTGVDINAELIFADARPTAGQPATAADIEGFGVVGCSIARRAATTWPAWSLERPQRNVHVRGLILSGGGQMKFDHATATYEDVVFDDVICDGGIIGLATAPQIVVRGGNMK